MVDKIKAPKMKRKEYEEKLRKLQVELCRLQEWVKHKGLKIIIAFEGRDAAGKGGTIKAITERVSPRVFRVVALPAPSDREKSQMFMQRYIAQFPAAGEIVIFDPGATSAIFGSLPRNRTIHRRRRYHVDQDLARSWKGGTGTTIFGSHQ